MHVHHLLYEPRPSGISRHVQGLLRMLPDVRHSVTLPAGLGGVAQACRALGAEVAEVRLESKVLPRAALRRLPARIRAVGADLLHLHALEAGPFGLISAALGGAQRVVFTPQTLEIRKRVLLPVLRRLLRRGGRERIKAWIAVSSGQVDELARWADPSRVHLVPNAAPPLGPAPDRAAARRALGWPQDELIVACVGRLAAQKDPWTFVRATRDLPGVWGVLVGEGPLEHELAPAVARASNLRLQGFVSEVSAVYAAADVIALPSLWEGLPYVLLEALASGTAVVASDIPGNVDLIRHDETGLLIPTGGTSALRSALERLSRDPALRASLAASGRERCSREFSEEAIAPRQLEVYRRALG